MTPTPEAMVETVAKLLFNESGGFVGKIAPQFLDEEWAKPGTEDTPYALSEESREHWRKLARAAIRALAPVIAEAWEAGSRDVCCDLGHGKDYANRIISTLVGSP